MTTSRRTRSQTRMTPVITPPRTYRTVSSAIVISERQSYSADIAVSTDGPDFPQGIDYGRWIGVVRPSPREAFADPLDLLDELPDD